MPRLKGSYSVIRSPLITEKSSREVAYQKYSFWVDKNANKIEIKKAIEMVYKVKVTKVTTMVVKGKTKKVRWNQPGKTSSWKKAMVTLAEGSQIKLT